MLLNHELRWAWPGHSFSLSLSLPISGSPFLLVSPSVFVTLTQVEVYSSKSVNPPKRCQLILLFSWLHADLKPISKKPSVRVPKSNKPRRNPHSQGFASDDKQWEKHSSKLIVTLNVLLLSLSLFFSHCFLFGAELSPLWTAWSNDTLGDCFRERGGRERESDCKGKGTRESKGRGEKGGVCSSSCWLFQDSFPTPIVFSLPSSQLFFSSALLLFPLSSAAPHLVCYPLFYMVESHFSISNA